MNLSEELKYRGQFKQTTFTDLSALNDQPITFYWGVDPSSDSMTVGNLAAAMMVKRFIKHGHKAVLLIGGATGKIGDPDGKSEERILMDDQQLEKNKQAIVNQYKTIFEGSSFDLVDNNDWFKDFGYLDFLRDVGKHVPMRQMLGRDFIRTRLGEEGSGISYAEFSYVLIQAYDFLYLYKNKGVTLQVCGSDQWGNSIAGVELIRRKENAEAHVYSTPLVVDSATGRKFGKSEEGAIWLDPNKTSPTKFYQFWINTADSNVENYLKIFTELDKEKIQEIMAKQNADPSQRYAQSCLADFVTNLVHGSEATALAQKVTLVITNKQPLGEVDEPVIANLRNELPSLKINLSDSIEVAEVLAKVELASSKTEARQLIKDGAIYINGQKTNEETLSEPDFINGRLIIRRGKALKDSALIELN